MSSAHCWKSFLEFGGQRLENLFYTSGLQRLAGVHDPPKSCDIPTNAEFYGDCDGGTG